MGDTERRHNDDAILEALQGVHERLDALEETVKPLSNLKGFWKVSAFFIGAVIVLAEGAKGVKYLLGILANK